MFNKIGIPGHHTQFLGLVVGYFFRLGLNAAMRALTRRSGESSKMRLNRDLQTRPRDPAGVGIRHGSDRAGPLSRARWGVRMGVAGL